MWYSPRHIVMHIILYCYYGCSELYLYILCSEAERHNITHQNVCLQTLPLHTTHYAQLHNTASVTTHNTSRTIYHTINCIAKKHTKHYAHHTTQYTAYYISRITAYNKTVMTECISTVVILVFLWS